jgi:hypothetical protein
METAAIEMNLGRERGKVIFDYAFAEKRSTEICMVAPAKNIFSSFEIKLKNIANSLQQLPMNHGGGLCQKSWNFNKI